MINSASNLPHRNDGEPKHRFSSKISSPTKRTLNNKNYLAEDAPAYDFKPDLEVELHEKLKISSLDLPEVSRKDENQSPFPQMHPGFSNKVYNSDPEPFGMPPKSKLLYQPLYGSVLPAPDYRNRNSPTKTPRSTNTKSKNPRCKEKHDASQVPLLSRSEKDSIIENRYFSPPIDLQKLRRPDGKSRAIIDVANSGAKNMVNQRTYKLTVPILTCDRSLRVVNDEIERIDRQTKRQALPENATTSNLGETNIQSASSLRNGKKTPALKRPLLPGSSANDSLELSFDGKALDRSDIFRMVDSFSVAQSDDEPDDEANAANMPSRNVLPAEMTGPAF